MKYEKLEFEAFPPKQKLQLLQNAVGDVTELSYIKQIDDQDVARGHPALIYDSYMELLLSACSTYDKKLSLRGKQKRAVYQIEIDKHDSTDYQLTMEDMKHTASIRIFWKSWPTLAIPIAMVVLVILVKRSQQFFQEMNGTN
jgi:hypothetical protein